MLTSNRFSPCTNLAGYFNPLKLIIFCIANFRYKHFGSRVRAEFYIYHEQLTVIYLNHSYGIFRSKTTQSQFLAIMCVRNSSFRR